MVNLFGFHFNLQGCRYAAPSKLKSAENESEEIEQILSKIEGPAVPRDLVNNVTVNVRNPNVRISDSAEIRTIDRLN